MNFYLDATPPATTTTPTPTGPPGTCSCGRFGFRADEEDWTRIVGGTVAAANSIPYQTKGDGEIFINVEAIINHPSYNSNTEDNDFALLRLSATAVVSSSVGFACLPPDTTQTFAGSILKISGWGTTSSSGSQSANLLFAYVNGMSNSACSSAYGGITANMICATGDNFTKDTCQGDSGGPMVAAVNSKITLVGVTSFGTGCAQSPYPGVYSRVSAQKSWILANSDAGNCQN